MRFLKGGGCPATPTLTPRACNPEPLRGHERLRGKQDGFVDEGGGGLCPAVALPALHCYCSAGLLPLNFTDICPPPIKKGMEKRLLNHIEMPSSIVFSFLLSPL